MKMIYIQYIYIHNIIEYHGQIAHHLSPSHPLVLFRAMLLQFVWARPRRFQPRPAKPGGQHLRPIQALSKPIPLNLCRMSPCSAGVRRGAVPPQNKRIHGNIPFMVTSGGSIDPPVPALQLATGDVTSRPARAPSW